MKVVPAIDLMGGRVVRLREGRREAATVYRDDPLEVLDDFARAGASLVHIVDLDGAFGGAPEQARVVASLLARSPVPLQVGGGLRTREAIERAAVARYIVLGTIAVKDPALARWACTTYPDRVVVAVDARDGKVTIEGWTETGELEATALATTAIGWGAAKILYTDVARDGTGVGPNVEATARLQLHAGTVPVIASGGIGSLEHIRHLAARGVSECVVGRALYEGSFTVEEAIAAGC